MLDLRHKTNFKHRVEKKTMFLLYIVFIFSFQFMHAQTNDSIYKSIEKYHASLNEEYANPKTSPLDSADLVNFLALNIYPINSDFYVMGILRKSKGEKKFKMKTSTDRQPLYKKYGVIYFAIQGAAYQLNVYKNIELSKKKEFKNYLFMPFTDLTSGETTYGGGRYIDLEIPYKNDVIMIDFNKAYNPYCAYTHRYSCPIPPPENFLNIKIEAGVKEGITYKK